MLEGSFDAPQEIVCASGSDVQLPAGVSFIGVYAAGAVDATLSAYAEVSRPAPFGWLFGLDANPSVGETITGAVVVDGVQHAFSIEFVPGS